MPKNMSDRLRDLRDRGVIRGRDLPSDLKSEFPDFGDLTLDEIRALCGKLKPSGQQPKPAPETDPLPVKPPVGEPVPYIPMSPAMPKIPQQPVIPPNLGPPAKPWFKWPSFGVPSFPLFIIPDFLIPPDGPLVA